MSYIKISDPVFDRPLALREAYRVMEHFALAFEARGDVPVSAFTMYLGIAPDGVAGDPAALHDFLDAAAAALGEPSLRHPADG